MRLVFHVLPFLLAAPAAFAQGPAVPVGDTVGYAKNYDVYYLGDLNRTNGTEERAYLPTRHPGYIGALNYYYSPPGQKQMAKREVLKMDGIRSMTVRGRYYEKIILNSEATDILAVRMLQGPVELFAYAPPKSLPVPLPLPGLGVVVVPVQLNNYSNYRWFVRHQGQLVAVSKGKFAGQISQLLGDYPALARQVELGEENYRYANILAIVQEYNAYVARLGK